LPQANFPPFRNSIPFQKQVAVPFAQIGPIAVHLPNRRETNADLQLEYPNWDMTLIGQKTGIHARHIAEENETAADLAVAAASKLFDEQKIDPATVDYILFCTQTPDYPLPTTSCLIQERLGISNTAGALDFNLGCSGFTYGLSLAEGLIQSGQAERILFLTAETYSKYISKDDRSLRPIFGDAAAATLIESSDTPSLTGFRFGTDGSGADTLLVSDGGARAADDAIRPRHRKRWSSRLYMDGPALINFTVGAVPQLVDQILERAKTSFDEIDLLLFHQATFKMLDQLRTRLGVDEDRLPIRLADCGNTVSCTLPILINDLRNEERISTSKDNLLVGFGVGWSWGGCRWRDTWQIPY
jgi:3-oxoacyl-[acyl-carrier-protein] synthase-3